MSVTTAKIRAREKATGKKANIGIDNAGNLHYAFDLPTLDSIIAKANVKLDAQTSAKAAKEAKDMAAYNNSLSQQNANAANKFNADQAALNRQFQADMSNTAHQREVADLKAAGLNPVLSAGGSGASSPSGSTASGSPASVDMGSTTAAVEMAKAAISAKTQLQMNRDNINSAQAMNNKSLSIQKELGKMGFDNSLAIAYIQDASSRYGVDKAYLSSKYSVDKGYESSKYSADKAYDSSKYGADKGYDSSKYSADSSAGASKYVVDNPNTLSGIIAKGATGDSNLGQLFINTGKKVSNALKSKKVVVPKGSIFK